MPVVMDADRIARTLTRIAHEIVERNRGIDELALVGIRKRGAPIAKRLAKAVSEISGLDIPTGALDITLYRDDLMRHAVGPQPLVRRTEIPFSIDDKCILLVDDVLYTGRTIRAALDALIDFGRPQGDPAGRPGGSRTSRAADQGRLRRQEPADVAFAKRPGASDGDRRPRRGGDSGIMKKDLLGIADLSDEEIYLILDTAEAMREIGQRPIKKVPTLRGKTVVNLFFEPSTRTRTSFEIAEKRLSADTLNIAVSTSSVLKGETLADTAMNIEAMSPDMIVLRHASSGACHLLAHLCKSRIINAGDGMHEHPTQALLDAFTIREHKKQIAGLKVAVVGDLLHSRVLRSNVLLLTRLGADVWLSGPPTLVPTGIERLGVQVSTSVDEAVADADVIMMLRIQQERMQGAFFPSVREYFTVFGMTVDRVKLAKPDVIIMHPGPMNRGVEIASEVADGPYSVILEQVANGVAVRMAVLYLLAGGVKRKMKRLLKGGRVVDPANGRDGEFDRPHRRRSHRRASAATFPPNRERCRGDSDRPCRLSGPDRHARAPARAGTGAQGDGCDRCGRGGCRRLHRAWPACPTRCRSTTTRASLSTC